MTFEVVEEFQAVFALAKGFARRGSEFADGFGVD